jgi:hypothetical protein
MHVLYAEHSKRNCQHVHGLMHARVEKANAAYVGLLESNLL